jgi:hypothetical protein
MRPGIASVLIPKAGTAQLCITSIPVINNLIEVDAGKYKGLSVSSKRSCPINKSDSGFI